MQQPAWNFVRVIPALKIDEPGPQNKVGVGGFLSESFSNEFGPTKIFPKKGPFIKMDLIYLTGSSSTGRYSKEKSPAEPRASLYGKDSKLPELKQLLSKDPWPIRIDGSMDPRRMPSMSHGGVI